MIIYTFFLKNVDFSYSAFHDCVSGSCDGCINQDNESNNGLATIIANLDAAYVDGGYNSTMSRTDFWVLAGISAIERLARGVNGVNCDFGEYVDKVLNS